MTGAEEFEVHLNAFLNLYRDHKDLLRFNQFFNVYIQNEDIHPTQMEGFLEMIAKLEEPFSSTYRKGKEDGTISKPVTAPKGDCIMPQITVIVPVYKVEPYLSRCVDSILSQTFTDFDLVLIDDGSPDRCGAICDEYAAAYSLSGRRFKPTM